MPSLRHRGQSLYSPEDTAIEVQKQGQTGNKHNHFVALADRQTIDHGRIVISLIRPPAHRRAYLCPDPDLTTRLDLRFERKGGLAILCTIRCAAVDLASDEYSYHAVDPLLIDEGYWFFDSSEPTRSLRN